MSVARVVAFVSLLAACGNAEPAVQMTAVRDSAGIEIVEIRGTFPAWRVVSDTVLRIGLVSGAEAYEFDNVTFAARLSDGGIVAADGGVREVRWFDATGRHVRTFGRRGEGPGEFGTMSQAAIGAGDTLVIHDARNQRLTWIAPGDTTWRERPLPGGAENALIGAGAHILVAVTGRGPIDQTSDFSRQSRTLAVVALSERSDTIALVRGPDTGWGLFAESRALLFALPLSAGPLFAQSGEHLVIADGSQPELRLVNGRGAVSRIIRLTSLEARPVREPERDSLMAHVENVYGEDRDAVEWFANEIALLGQGDFVALFDRMFVGADRLIWIRRYRPDWAADAPQQWLVLQSDGMPAGALELKDGFELMHAGDGFITGVETDSLDVQYVVTLAIEDARN